MKELSEVDEQKTMRQVRRCGELLELLRASEDPNEWANISTELTPMLTAYWDYHPHSAMEVLEQAVLNLSVELAKPLVRDVVLAWRKKPTYRPDAGGSADHCYLSALILSDNSDLAEYPWAEGVLPRTLDKELNDRDRMRDYDRKRVLVRNVQHSSRKFPRRLE